MLFESAKSAALEKSFSANWQRMQLINHNIANEDTPGFKAKKLAFEGMLRNELRHVNSSRGLTRMQKVARVENTVSRVYDDPTLSVRADGNNVNLDNENIELTRVQLQYRALRDKINGHYNNLQMAIRGTL